MHGEDELAGEEDEGLEELSLWSRPIYNPSAGSSGAGPSGRGGTGDAGGDASRVVLHIDCDEFFLQVHGLLDPRLQALILGKPCALWQFNDVISINAAAKAAGVRKHMLPQQAAAKLGPAGGHLVHAFWRKWPGPRVNYRHYNAASRSMLTHVAAILADGGGAVVEKASIDEVYVDATGACGGCLAAGGRLGERIQAALASSLGLRVSVGAARNKLLAKLASTAAKVPASLPPPLAGAGLSASGGALRLCVVDDPGSRAVEALLEHTAAAKLPGLGTRSAQLAAAGITSAASLQTMSTPQVREALELPAEAAERAWRQCRGQDDSPVVPTGAPKSLTVTSWTTHTALADIALRRHSGRGGEAVVLGAGRWLFEAHTGERRSNDTRCRWILLAMALDLADKVIDTWLQWGELPTKMTVGWNGCGTDPIPGPGFKYLNHEARSRSVSLPVSAQQAFVAAAGSAASRLGALPQFGDPAHAPAGDAAFDPAAAPLHLSPNMTLTEEGPAVLEDAAYRGCVAVLVDTAAGVLHGFVQEDSAQGIDRQIAQLTLGASGFQRRSHQQGITAWLQRGSDADKAHVPASPQSPRTSAKRSEPPLDNVAPESRPATLEAIPAQGRGIATATSKGSPSLLANSSALARAPSPAGKSAPPGWVDSSAWTALPEDIQAELANNWQLRDQQRMAGSASQQPAAPTANGTAHRAASQAGARPGSKRKAAAPAGCAPIRSFFEPQKHP